MRPILTTFVTLTMCSGAFGQQLRLIGVPDQFVAVSDVSADGHTLVGSASPAPGEATDLFIYDDSGFSFPLQELLRWWGWIAHASADGSVLADVSAPTAPTVLSTSTTGACDNRQSYSTAIATDTLAYVFESDVMIEEGLATMARNTGNGYVVAAGPASGQCSPVIVGTVDTPGGARGVVVSGCMAYVADRGSGFQAIDVSDPMNPVILGGIDTGFAFGVAISGSVAYVADRDSGLHVIDVSDPENPVILGSIDTPDQAFDVVVSGTTAFVADRASGLQVIDVSDPTKPEIVGAANTPGLAFRAAARGTVVYVADDSSGLLAIDVSNPSSPVIVGAIDTPGFTLDVAVEGTVAYVASDASGLHVIDVSDPTNPLLLGSVDTPDQAFGVTVMENLAYVADNAGLQIIDVSDPANPVIVGAVETPRSALDVAISGTLAYVADFEAGLHAVDVSSCVNVCPEDLDGDGHVGFGDILAVLSAWGNPGGPEDLDGSGTVSFGDLIVILVAWGPCG